jgi:transcriptional regulator with XRE-family HTH domain
MRLDHLSEGTRTRLLRVAMGLSQHDLATRVGVDRRRLSEHERNQRALSPADAERIRVVLAEEGAPLADAPLPGAA